MKFELLNFKRSQNQNLRAYYVTSDGMESIILDVFGFLIISH